MARLLDPQDKGGAPLEAAAIPGPDGASMDEDFRWGIALWNAGRYLEAHEAFERLWMVEVGPGRHFLRGLIHAAMGFHYVTLRDTVSARSKLSSAADLLDGFPGDFLGVDVDGLRTGIASFLKAPQAARDPGALAPEEPVILPLISAATGAARREERG